MKVLQNIQLVNTNLLHPLIKDYYNNLLNNNLYQFNPIIESIPKAIDQRKNFPIDRKKLVLELTHQYQLSGLNLDDDSKVWLNIKTLEQDTAFTITTGHQLCTFGGPLFMALKIASCISACKNLEKEFPNYQFIPVFWMASEDSDIEEVSSLNLFNKTLSWNTSQSGITGALQLNDLQNMLEEVCTLLGTNSNFALELVSLFKEAYTKPNLSQATRFLFHNLFKDYGLVIIDANATTLKQNFKEVLAQELTNQFSFNSVSKTQEVLSNYKLPVNPREINLFYLTNNQRTRIIPTQEGFIIGDKSISKQALIEESQTNPERFSPNVVLRPFYQESILPNLAYIGGTNEIAYWLELKSAFDTSNVFYPMLLVRDSALILTDKITKDLNKLSLNITEFIANSLSTIQDHFILKQKDNDKELVSPILLLNSLNQTLDTLKNSIQTLPKDKIPSLIKQLNELQKAASKIKKEIKTIEEENLTTELQKISAIYEWIYPNKTFRERYDSFIPYYLKYGNQFISTLIEEGNPFLKKLTFYQ